MRLFLYADEGSTEVLAAGRKKALLLGSDFGYGNFGDVLQHMGAAARIKAMGHCVASVLTLDAIPRHVSVSTLRERYAVDALVFVSVAPLDPETVKRLRLRSVRMLRNVSCIQLYGGGFLNAMWGDFVLSVAEHFLERFPGARYVISGQQVSKGYESRLRDHVARFVPKLIGLRDRDSLRRMGEHGIDGEFSFDDATESLVALSEKLRLQDGDGVFIHLNTSGYTGNNEALDEMKTHLQTMADRTGGRGRAVLLQAFQDAREEVVDTLETVKRFETGFPFVDVDTVMLVAAAMAGRLADPSPLLGRFGYSSSYHVALWLQLAGIPCWLRGSNEYYEQKRRALGIEGDFDAFLERMQRPDHGENLRAREEWLEKLASVLEPKPDVENVAQWDFGPNNHDGPARTFNFKGEPRLMERLDEVWAQLAEKSKHINGLQQQLHSSWLEGAQTAAKLDAAIEQITELGAECHDLRRKLGESELRMQAYSEQLTSVGNEARYYHDQYDSVLANYEALSARERDLSEQLRIVASSRIWRWTRPIRIANRFIRQGHFDLAGNVGLYRALQIAGQKLPIPQHWKSAVGRVLVRFRRR